MTIVRIIKNWDYPDWRQMSPGGSGVWDGITFTQDPIEAPDYVIVLNQPNETVAVNVPENRVWALIQEPPTRFHKYLHKGQRAFAKVYTSDEDIARRSTRHITHYPVLPWHVQRTFDDLCSAPPIPPKSKDLSWITSSLAFLPGHKDRMRLLQTLSAWDGVDMFGKGINFIEDKWDGLAPYRYSIVYENHISAHYWSEKLVDCFLAGTMPIYVGCTDLSAYFPKGSFARLDPNCADPVAQIKKITQSTLAEDNRAELIEARRRCLHELQILPFLAEEIAKDTAMPAPRRDVVLRRRRLWHPVYLGKAVWHWKIRPLLKRV